MKKIRTALSVLLVAWLLQGCIKGGYTRGEDPRMDALISTVEADPDNVTARSQLASAYFARYQKLHKPADREAAIEQYRILLKQAPDHVDGNVGLYALLTTKAIEERVKLGLPELHALFKQIPAIRESGLLAPSLVEALIDLSNKRIGDDLSRVRELLQQAAGETPSSPKPYMIQADLYLKEGQFEPAVAALERAVTLAPGELNPRVMLANVLYEKLDETGCREDKRLLQRTLEATKSAAKLKPDEAGLHFMLAKLYLTLGQDQAYLFEAQQVAVHYKDVFGRLFLAQAWRDLGDLEGSLKEYEAIGPINEYKRIREEGLARSYFTIMDWPKAAKHMELSESAAIRPDIYKRLLYVLAEEKQGHTEKARQLLLDFPEHGLEKEWQRRLHAYHLHKLSADDLLAHATNVCEQTEAHFFIGFQHWLSGDIEAAQVSFQKVVELDYRPFRGFAMARYVLENGLKEN